MLHVATRTILVFLSVQIQVLVFLNFLLNFSTGSNKAVSYNKKKRVVLLWLKVTLYFFFKHSAIRTNKFRTM